MKSPILWSCLLAVSLLLGACGGEDRSADTDTLVVLTPHNDAIQAEFARAFRAHYQATIGREVEIDWRPMGSREMLELLRNSYARTEAPGYDVVFGGGENVFMALAEAGLLVPADLDADTLAQIPARHAGQPFRDPQNRWIGSAVSGFGFLYRTDLLEMRGVAPPTKWEDLGAPAMYDMLALADPTQSGSVAAAYEMVILSAPTWEQGWAKLLSIMGNAKKFLDSASKSADAPRMGEAPVAMCIDFYGQTRAVANPDKLRFAVPSGQSAYSTDPVGVLKNAPGPAVAQEFVRFVLSPDAQALWALPKGHPKGPVEYELGRQPVRRDVYELYGKDFLPWTVNPYAAGEPGAGTDGGANMTVDPQYRLTISQVLGRLVKAAAIDNSAGLRAAKKRVLESNDPALLAEFARLPDNADTIEDLRAVGAILTDESRKGDADRILTDWQRFFRDKYASIVAP